MAKKRKTAAKKRSSAKKRAPAKKRPAAKRKKTAAKKRRAPLSKSVNAKVTCPECKYGTMMKKTGNGAKSSYKCDGCGKNIKAKDCCVFCDYSNKPCPCCK